METSYSAFQANKINKEKTTSDFYEKMQWFSKLFKKEIYFLKFLSAITASLIFQQTQVFSLNWEKNITG